LRPISYELYEFLGDSVIHLIIAQYLFNRYKNKDEGFLTNIRISIEQSSSLANLSKKLNFDKYILLSKSSDSLGTRINPHILEDIFESFFGALFVDSSFNYGICFNFLSNLMESEIDFANLIYFNKNFKGHLLHLFHKNGWPDPVYVLLKTINSSSKMFHMGVLDISGSILSSGFGKTKKQGEQEAAKKAILLFSNKK
jgi:ribonuclease-3